MKDFMNYGEVVIDFSKLSNLIVVVGMEDQSIKSSNGVGKTNLFNAIKYVLFNSKISNAKDKVIRHNTNKCEVSFIFELNDKQIYKIDRVRTKSTQMVKIYIKDIDNWKDISAKTSMQTEQIISNIIGVSEQTFCNSSYLQQNDFKRRKIDNLPNATPEEKKEIILDMLQLEIWEKCEEQTKKLRDATQVDLNKTKSLIENIGLPKDIIAEKQLLIAELEKIILQTNEQISELSVQLKSKNDLKNELKNSLSDEAPKLEKQLKEESIVLQKIEKNIFELQKHGKKYKTEKEKSEQDVCNLKIKEKNKNKDLLELNSQEAIQLPDIESVLNDISRLKNKIRENRSVLDLAKKPIPDGEICRECGTDLNFEARQALSINKNNKAAELEKEIKEDTEVLNKLLLDKAEADNNLLKQNQRSEKINKLKNELEIINLEISNLRGNILTNEARIKDNEFYIKEETTRKLEKDNNIVDINNKLLLIDQKDIENKISIIDREISIIDNDINRQRKALSNYTLDLGQSQAILTIKQKELIILETYEADRKKLEKQLLLYKAALSCFGSNGVPALIIHSVLTTLQNKINIIIEKLKPKLQLKFIISKENDKGEKTDTLNIIYYKDNVELDFLDLSGGEEASVVLASKLAMADINRCRQSIGINLLLLDEVESALDSQSVDRFIDVIKELSEEMTVLVITHNNNLKEKFSSSLMIKSKNSISEIDAFNGEIFVN